MNIDEQLRAALRQEADMQHAPAPDMERLVHGGKVRKRRRNLAAVAVLAAVALVAGAGGYGLNRFNSSSSAQPATTTQSTTPQAYPEKRGAQITPGTYRMVVSAGSDDVPIRADLTFGAGWQADDYPVLSIGNGPGAVGIYEPTGLATGTGCLSENKLNTHLGQDPQSLAAQLAHLPSSTVIQSPQPVQAFGYDAVHLQLRITQDCGSDVYRVAETPRGGHGISYSDTPGPVIIDFWVLEIGTVPVVVDAWHETDASSQVVDEIDQTRSSIKLVTAG